MAKIVVIVRTRDEAANIGRFCESYQWADRIVVADGGSVDETVSIAQAFPNVMVRGYPIKIPMANGYWRNPHGPHINFLIDTAMQWLYADWIIFDDCDCVPNYLVREEGRKLIETCELDYINITRLYLWGQDKHFPNLAKPRAHEWCPTLWAWRALTNLHFRSDRPETLQEPQFHPPGDRILNLLPPYCLLHYAWPTPEKANAKVKFYEESGQIPGMQHPLKFGGPLEALPEWAHR